MQEEWVSVEEFPDYEVSNYGLVKRNDRLVIPSRTRDGTCKVNLRREGKTYTRSVKVLVARAFVYNPHPDLLEELPGVLIHPRHRPVWDTPINLDNDQENNSWVNLAWRPRWFAWKYKHQFDAERLDEYYLPVLNSDTGVIHDDVITAGINAGVLWFDIVSSCLTNRSIFPYGHTYYWVE